MKQHIGVHLINATAGTENDCISKNDPEAPIKESGNAPGYLIEMPGDVPKYSWLNAEDFQKVYRPSQGIPFSFAIEALKQGYTLRLPHWPEGVNIAAQASNEEGEMDCPYIYIQGPHGKSPWSPSAADIFSENFELIGEMK